MGKVVLNWNDRNAIENLIVLICIIHHKNIQKTLEKLTCNIGAPLIRFTIFKDTLI